MISRQECGECLNDSFAAVAASSLVEAYNKFAARIEELGLPAAVDVKPILDVSSFPPCSSVPAPQCPFSLSRRCMTHADGLVSSPHALMWCPMQGKEIMKVLEATPGPWMGQVLARVIEWQLEHPKGTKQECEAWLRVEQAGGRVSTVNTTVKRGQGGTGDAKTKKAKR